MGETVAEAKDGLHDAPEEGTGEVLDGEREAAQDNQKVSNAEEDHQVVKHITHTPETKEIYGYEDLVIVSDDFHVGRALFIADRFGINAVALESKPVDPSYSRGVRTREFLARVKAVIDLYWLEGPEPFSR